MNYKHTMKCDDLGNILFLECMGDSGMYIIIKDSVGFSKV